MKKLFADSSFAPFGESLFTTLWIAAFVSNVGTWMQNVGVGWVAATLSASPVVIALIQTASSLPALLFSYLAGVISDQYDRRKLLMYLQLFLFAVVLVLSVITYLHLLNINLLILFTFFVGTGYSFMTPTWQAITPEVISKEHLREAIALNGVNFNLSRAVGPALGGVILVWGGVESIFLFNSVSFLILLWGIFKWKSTPSNKRQNESILQAGKEGLRAVKKSTEFRYLLIRTISFTFFSSAIFALLPQLSKYEWDLTSSQYTWLWISLGIGALVGSYFYGIWNKMTTSDNLAFVSAIVLSLCFLSMTLLEGFFILNLILFVTGIFWIHATTILNVLAQQYSPERFRGRFLAVNVTIFQGGIAVSSLLWGFLAEQYSSAISMRIAAIAMLVVATIVFFFVPLKEAAPSKKGVACSDALAQYQLHEEPAGSLAE